MFWRYDEELRWWFAVRRIYMEEKEKLEIKVIIYKGGYSVEI